MGHDSCPTVLYYVFVLLLGRFKSISKDMIDAPKFWIPTIVIPFAMQGYILAAESNLPPSVIEFIWATFFAVFLIGLTILMFYLYNTVSVAYEEKFKLSLDAQEKEYYRNQCQLMQESVENIKTIRHDMKLHLATAMDFTASGQANEAAHYLKSLLGDIEAKEVYSNTHNLAFDSIINYKLNDARQRSIKLDIRVLIPPILNIEVADIVTIIGNLLDNALDAVATVEDKMIKLDIEYSKESLFIQVENTFDGEVKYAGEMIITRKRGDGHGYGLKNIQKSVEKYNGYISINHSDNVFSVGILLYV